MCGLITTTTKITAFSSLIELPRSLPVCPPPNLAEIMGVVNGGDEDSTGLVKFPLKLPVVALCNDIFYCVRPQNFI